VTGDARGGGWYCPSTLILYHFPTSPFSRRARLALAHKGLSVELRDARASDEHRTALRKLNPVHMVPLLVDGDRVVADSTAIAHYVDRKVPDPPLWPAGAAGAAAFEIVALTDTVAGVIADLGLRYSALSDHPGFNDVKKEYIGRVQGALDRLAELATAASLRPGGVLVGDSWSFADMSLVSVVVWLENMPGRVASFPPARNIMALGWTLPSALSAWADRHRQRPDVAALG
jgi:glutathione S-transferase